MDTPSTPRHARHSGIFLLALSVAFATALTTVPSIASACSCAAFDAHRDLANHEVVFFGRFVRSSPHPDGTSARAVIIEVIRAWKGVRRGEEIEITQRGGGMCVSPNFAEGTWIVVANRDAAGMLTTGACNISHPARTSSRTYRELAEAARRQR